MSGPPPARASWTDTWLAPAALAAASLVVYARSTLGEYVYDDRRFIPDNPLVQQPASWLRFLTDPLSADPKHTGTAIVRPLRTVEFAADRALFGTDPFAFHVHSLLWHVAAALLLLAVLRRLVPDARAAFAGALLFAVHPSQVESVAWISGRGDVAMGACALASVLFALRSKGFDRDFIVSIAAAFVAMLYKETAIAIPVVVAALRLTRLSRVPVWPYAAAAAAYFVYRTAVLGPPVAHATFVLGGGTAGALATMTRAFGFYIAETVLPAPAVDWYLTASWSFAEAAVLAWLAVHAGLIATAFVVRARAPAVALAIAWFYAFLIPVANWPWFLGIPTSERFLYLPIAGAAIAAAFALSRAPRAALAAALTAAAALGGATVLRAEVWHDEDALWRDALADHECPRARGRQTFLLRRDGIELRARIASMPQGPARDAATARVTALFEEALRHAHVTLNFWCGIERTERPANNLIFEPETNAANLCYLLGRDEEALFHAEEALRMANGVPQVHYTRALVLLRLGFAPQAVASMERARDLGFSDFDAELGEFFLRAAARCEADRVLSVAERACADAVELAPAGPLRRTAQVRLARIRVAGGADAAAEARRIADLDDALSRVPRRCPERRVGVAAK
jgi:tetratricopeptide (TPR) repeat protein